jgi:hypothetical protein
MKSAMQPVYFLLVTTIGWTAAHSGPARAADPWADQVISYLPGTAPEPGFIDASTALGEPTRNSAAYGGYVVSPFSGASDATELVSLGAGGELVVKFDEPVVDDPANPFGIDLLIFGNSFLGLSGGNYDETDLATGAVFSEGGAVSVSADGISYFPIVGLEADGLFPTNGYSDITAPFPASGSLLADFTRPVDPSFDVTGLNTAAVVAGYNGSGGGAGIDLASVGLAAISYVKITNPLGSGTTPEIDGFADVQAIPEPSGASLIGIAALAFTLYNGRNTQHALANC